jgi:hypothetical protein
VVREYALELDVENRKQFKLPTRVRENAKLQIEINSGLVWPVWSP